MPTVTKTQKPVYPDLGHQCKFRMFSKALPYLREGFEKNSHQQYYSPCPPWYSQSYKYLWQWEYY